MSLSKECRYLFEVLVKTYTKSKDKNHQQIYSKLLLILDEIRNFPERHSDLDLIGQLSASAVISFEDNPHFASAVKTLIHNYQQRTSTLNLLTPLSKTGNTEQPLELEKEQTKEESPGLFFLELQAAFRKRAERMTRSEIKAKFLNLP
ncbi:Uncharacterised protein [Legionella lansingensis]|uniref:Uncharacterized protein n=1 Tax=Legionella lansingensis TaxID=45067 RepID=A0A0W0VGJ7_9GAMM|nr:hypothetical protein [Legionella lansingensis]KTD19262.1 hypothetical protein Llan_2114 [Legionella lansingensis]SNV50575.1 Uncharacterised protein [Legionella lansingensis]